MLKRIRTLPTTLLASRHVLWLVPALAAALLSFGLGLGWIADDFVHRAALTDHPELPELHREPGQLFSFVDGDPETVERLVRQGTWPWWSDPDLRLAFWRPLSGWTHAFDYFAWPESPTLMHAHSLAWFLLALFLLLLLYRRSIPSPALAGLAGLLYAVDDSQALPVLWLANRNAIIALSFGTAAILAHDQWRRDGWRPGAALTPLLLLLALLANEGAVAVGGYLLAHALFLDPARNWRGRFLALAPATSLGLAWAVAYKMGGYGAHGSAGYLDLVSQPLAFARAAIERGPALLWGWWAFPPADLMGALADALRWRVLLALVPLLALLAWGLWPLLRREAAARFFGLGMLLALVPACSTFPSNRLLVFAGIGGAGLLALWIGQLTEPKVGGLARRWGRGALLCTLVGVHLLISPLFTRVLMTQMSTLNDSMLWTAESLVAKTSGNPKEQVPVVVVSPSAFLALGAQAIAPQLHSWKARPHHVLAAGTRRMEIRRRDRHTLEIRPLGGFLRPPGAADPPGSASPSPTLDPRRSFLLLDQLFRDTKANPFRVGPGPRLDGVDLEILAVEEGRPQAVAFRFEHPLDDERWLLLAWQAGQGYVPFPLPPVGGEITWPGFYEQREPR